MAEQKFDVFLCYNTEDRAAVIAIAQQLRQNGLKPWMDILELQPGEIWQFALEQQIESIGAAAVFIGKQGLGPWQSEEIYAFLQEFKRRRCPVIPVMLHDAPQQPNLPFVLRNRHWVDLRVHTPDPFMQLIWGITGQRPIFQAANELAERVPLSHELDSDDPELESQPAVVETRQQIPKATEPDKIHSEDDLSSERNIDYTRLRDLLKAKKWKDADKETTNQMVKAIGKAGWSKVTFKDLSNFPCTDLETLDHLWVKYSDGKWGFSIQTRIWKECGSPTEYNDDWERFGDRVGWRKNETWLSSNNITFDLQKSLPGELPTRPHYWGGGAGGIFWSIHLFPRAEGCKP